MKRCYSTVSTKAVSLVAVSLDADRGADGDWDGNMAFLQGRASFQLQKGVDHLLTVVEDRPQFLSALISDVNEISQEDGLPSQLRGDCSAQEAIFIKHANFTHVPWVKRIVASSPT
jgi:hypothetical protein